jgi:hypothetical protein
LRAVLDGPLPHEEETTVRYEPAGDRGGREEKAFAAILAEKDAWHKWDNSTLRVIEKATKEIERMGEDFERDSKREIQSQQRAKPKQQQPAVVVPIDNLLGVCGGMVV